MVGMGVSQMGKDGLHKEFLNDSLLGNKREYASLPKKLSKTIKHKESGNFKPLRRVSVTV
jgi:hypothetical protein